MALESHTRTQQQVFQRAHANEPDARGRHACDNDKESDNLVAQLLVAAAKAGLKLFRVGVDWVWRLGWVGLVVVGAFGVWIEFEVKQRQRQCV